MNIEVKNTLKPFDYADSMKILEKRVEDVFWDEKDELLWILEHNTVYTAGTNSKEEDVLDKNLKIIKTNRGGKHTLHSPGQKVIYFVLNLNKRKKDIRVLVQKIEKCIIEVLKEYKISFKLIDGFKTEIKENRYMYNHLTEEFGEVYIFEGLETYDRISFFVKTDDEKFIIYQKIPLEKKKRMNLLKYF